MDASWIIIVVVIILALKGTFSGYHYEKITRVVLEKEWITSMPNLQQSFCTAINTTVISSSTFYENIPKRKPGEISKLKCNQYVMCSSSDNSMYQHMLFIHKGFKTQETEFPHMAVLGYEFWGDITWRCGGSLISHNYVLTASHCLHSTELGPPRLVRLGITNIKDTKYLQEVEVSNIIMHPHYKMHLNYHDIGLLELSKNVFLNEFVRPACLNLETDINMHQPIATGWGDTYHGSGKGSSWLLKAALEFFDVQTCNHVHRRRINRSNSRIMHGILDETMFCAGSTTDFKDTCEGDSGGPIQVMKNGLYFLIGVTTSGTACGVANNFPGIYTKVSSYLQWIEDIVWPEKI